MARAGRYQFRVAVKKPSAVRSKDAAGREVATFDQVHASWPADIQPLSGRSAFIAAQRNSEATHEVTLPYGSELAAIDSSWVVVFGTRVFVQDAPPRNVDERGVELVLTCLEGMRTQ